jgi:hypothetical protein
VTPTASRLKLTPGKWYGWQMLPGYLEGYCPYLSPILVEKVILEKTGQSWLNLNFFNAFYAEGVQDFKLRLKILDRTQDYLIARLDSDLYERHAIVNRISFEWLQRQLPAWYNEAPKETMPLFASSEIDYYLNQRFFGALRPLGPVPQE